MRTAALVTGSLALNLALLACVYVALQAQIPRSQFSKPPCTHAPDKPLLPLATARPTTPDLTAGEPFRWSQIESQDYCVYAANLRAIGCPATTLRDIIVADVNSLYARRVEEMVDAVQGQFWEFVTDKEKLEKLIDEKGDRLRKLETERDQLLSEVLGNHGRWASLSEEESIRERTDQRRHILDFLPADKIAQILAMDKRFDQLRAELDESRQGLLPDQVRAAYTKLKAEQQAELQSVLAPEQLDEYNLRHSRFAEIRKCLAAFTGSESELKQIVRIQETTQHAIEQAGKDPLLKASAAQLETQQLQALLGPERFQEYNRALDYTYQQLHRLGERLGLPSDTAVTVYSMRQAADQAVADLTSNLSLAEEQRHTALAAIRAETERSIASALPPQAFAALRQHWQGWFDGLAQMKR